MGQLVAKNLKEFLKDNGYNWSGYIAEYNGKKVEEYYICDKYKGDLDNRYILLGKQYTWDEDIGWVNVIDDSKHVKYIKQDDITFKVYIATYEGPKLEKDLSNEWIKYQALNVNGYAQGVLNMERYIQLNYPRDIESKKNLLAQEIERITREANSSIKYMEERVARSKEVEEVLSEVVEWEV